MGDGGSCDHLFKVVLVGDSGVGNSTLLTRFTTKESNSNLLSRLTGGFISGDSRSIIGATSKCAHSLLSRFTRGTCSVGIESTSGLFATRTINVDGTAIKASVWDTSPERYQTVKSTYHQDAVGTLIVYDITSHVTFENAKMWLKEVQEHNNDNMVIMLIGNKADLSHTRVVSAEDGRAFAVQENIDFMETSALNSLDVENAFTKVLGQIYRIVSANALELSQNPVSLRNRHASDLNERKVLLDLKDGSELTTLSSSMNPRRWKWRSRRSKKDTTDARLYEAISQNDRGLLEKVLESRHNHVRRGEIVINVSNGPLDSHSCNGSGRHPRSYLTGVTIIGDTILHIAAHAGNLTAAKRICQESNFLLKRGNKRSETPLHYAVQAGSFYLVKYFIGVAREEGSSALKKNLRRRNLKGETALYQAVQYGHVDIVEMLVSADMEDDLSVARMVGICDSKAVSPIYLATMQKYGCILSALVEPLSGVLSWRAFSGPNGSTALHIAAALGEKGLVDKLLGCMPALTRAVDGSGNIPLHYAASTKNSEIVKVLIEKDIRAAYMANSSGSYAIHIAAKAGHLEALIEIIKQCPGCEELCDKKGRNFLHLAVEEKNKSVVQWACKAKFIRVINAQDGNGDTPLHLAVKYKDVATFAALMSSNIVQFNLVNNNGLTPLDIAGAQKSITALNWQNADYVIWLAFSWIDPFSILNITKSLKIETDKEKKERLDKEKEEVDRYENIARTISIGSVFIASATLALLFTVAGIFVNKWETD